MNHHATQVGIVLQLLHQLRHVRQQERRVLALHQHALDGVETDATHDLLLVVALLLEIGHQQVSQFEGVTQAGTVAYLHDVQADVLQQRVDILGTHLVMSQFETDTVHTLHQDVQRLFVSCHGVAAYNDVLADIPFVGVFLVAANEREFAGQCIRSLEVLQVLTTVEGLYVEALIRSPHESLLEVGTFQVHFNLVQPFLFGRSLKLAEEFFFVCHK